MVGHGGHMLVACARPAGTWKAQVGECRTCGVGGARRWCVVVTVSDFRGGRSVGAAWAQRGRRVEQVGMILE